MNHEVETELKMLLEPTQMQRLLAGKFKNVPFIHQANTYYRSNNHNHYAFRIRERNGETLFTLKEHQGDELMEFEKAFTGNMENDPELMELLASFNEYPPFEVLGQLDTLRADLNAGLAVISLDINFYNGTYDYEIEYEVKKPHDYHEAFTAFLNEHDIEFKQNKVSKYRRFLKTMKEDDHAA